MNQQQEQDRQEIELIKNELVLVVDGADVYLSAMALLEMAFDVLGSADFYDELSKCVSVFYDEHKEIVQEEKYAEQILRLCHGK